MTYKNLDLGDYRIYERSTIKADRHFLHLKVGRLKDKEIGIGYVKLVPRVI
jgi:hypothetical protein